MHEEIWEVERKFTICTVFAKFFRAKNHVTCARGEAEGKSVNIFALRFSASNERRKAAPIKGGRAVIIIVPMIAKTILI